MKSREIYFAIKANNQNGTQNAAVAQQGEQYKILVERMNYKIDHHKVQMKQHIAAFENIDKQR